jgi:diguanylate cyclase (GGDEF)-like protein
MKIYHNFSNEKLNKIRIDYPRLKYVESIKPKLEKYDIFLEFIKDNLYQITYQNKVVNCNSDDLQLFFKLIIEIHYSKFEAELNIKKYFFELNSKLKLSKENATLKKKLIYDNKFNCYNYGYFKIQCQNEVENYKRYLEPFSIILLDIDDFKNINDEFGHNAGDIALENIIEAIKKNIRSIDMVFRFGGDEFMVLLHKAMMVGSLIVSKRIQTSINNISFEFNGILIENKITSSLGIVTVSEEFSNENLEVEELFKKADIALYKAKNTGKNKIIHFENSKQY